MIQFRKQSASLYHQGQNPDIALGIEALLRVWSLLGLASLLLFAAAARAMEIAPVGKVTFSLSTPEETREVELHAQ